MLHFARRPVGRSFSGMSARPFLGLINQDIGQCTYSFLHVPSIIRSIVAPWRFYCCAADADGLQIDRARVWSDALSHGTDKRRVFYYGGLWYGTVCN